MKIKWGGLIETVNELEGKCENPYLESLVQKLQKIEQCNSIHQMRKIINSFSEYDRNYLNSKILDDLSSSEYTRTISEIRWMGKENTTPRTVPKGRKRKNCTLRNAAKKGHFSVVQFMYEKGFFRIKNEPEKAFIYALENGHFDIVYFLVNNGVNIRHGNDRAAYISCKNGYLDFLIYLEQKGLFACIPDPERRVQIDENMFYKALTHGRIDIVRYFMKKNIVLIVIEYAIIHAIKRNYLDVLQYIYDMPADIICKGLVAPRDSDYILILSSRMADWAFSYGNSEVLRFILEKCPSVRKDFNCFSIKHVEIIKFLYEELKMPVDTLRKIRYYYDSFENNKKFPISDDNYDSFELVKYMTEKGILEFSNRYFQYYMLYTCANEKIIGYMKEKKFKFDFTYFRIENGKLKHLCFTIPEILRNVPEEFLPVISIQN